MRCHLPPLARQLGQQHLGVHHADEVAQRLGAGGDDLGGAVGADLAGKRSSMTRTSSRTRGSSASR
jgi:hypothetical protein